jgi:hypothetical protein
MSEIAEAIAETLLAITEKRRSKAVEKGDVLEAILADIAEAGLVQVKKSIREMENKNVG